MKTKRVPQKNIDRYHDDEWETFSPWLDYWDQLSLIREAGAKSVLEIGPGLGTLGLILKKRGYKYKTADIEKSLNPDYLCDVTRIPVKANSFDVVCAFQVLEHIPYEEFEKALIEMRRVAKKQVIISIPFSTIYFSMAFSFFYTTHLNWLFKLLNMKPLVPKYINIKIPTFFFDTFGMIDNHYWEMGRKNYPKSKILNSIIKAGYSIEKQHERIFYPYHYFFVLNV